MSAPGNTLLTTGLGLLLVVVVCYTLGRLHQWYRTTTEREAAFRDGYDTATTSLFSLATRTSKGAPERLAPARGAAAVISINTAASARHRADEITDSGIETGGWQPPGPDGVNQQTA